MTNCRPQNDVSLRRQGEDYRAGMTAAHVVASFRRRRGARSHGWAVPLGRSAQERCRWTATSVSWAHGSSGALVLMAAPTIAGSPSQGLAPSRSRLPLVHGMRPVMLRRRMDALDRSARSRARRTTFKGVVAVLTPVCRLGCGDRQGPKDAGVAIRQRAVFQVGAVRVGKADQQVVAVRPGQPRFSDGKAVLEIEVMIGVVVGGRAQEISEAFVTDRSGEDEFEAAGVRLNRGPAAGGDVGPAVGTRPWADGADPQARNRFPSARVPGRHR